jgi:16S rRNA (guanine527-N7)-methyltransferase
VSPSRAAARAQHPGAGIGDDARDPAVAAAGGTGTAAAPDAVREALRASLALLPIEPPGDACDKLAAYVALLDKWNRTYNLTAIREPARMVTHHVLDALAILPHLAAPVDARVLDVGSGGGVPGIPLAIARPQWHVTLLDSNRKKTTFLTQAVIELGLENVDVATARVEAFAAEAPYDVVVSRAYADLADFATGAAAHVASDGVLAAMKGVHPDEELRDLPSRFEVIGAPAVNVPGLDATRHLVIMRDKSK